MKAKVVLDIENSEELWLLKVTSNKGTIEIKISGKTGKKVIKDAVEVEHKG